MDNLFEIIGTAALIILGFFGLNFFNKKSHNDKVNKIKDKYDPKLNEMKSNLDELKAKAEKEAGQLDDKAKIEDLTDDQISNYWDNETKH